MARGGFRPGSGPAKGTKYKTKGEAVAVIAKPKKSAKAKPETVATGTEEATTLDNDTPLEYLLKVMNTTTNDTSTRLRAASLAAPFMHSRKGEGAGKKEEKADRAKSAGAGRFAASPPPLKLVK